jgi:integrase
MARPRTGSVVRKRTRLGISYALRFSYRGERVFHALGGSWEGWTEERVEQERIYIAEQVGRGEYVPPAPPAAAPRSQAATSFQFVASEWLARKARELPDGVDGKTYTDLNWRLAIAIEHFGNVRVSRIAVRTIDDMVGALLSEREEAQAAIAAGEPLMQDYYDPRRGQTYQRKKVGLSNNSINQVIRAVRSVLKYAKRQGLIDAVPIDDDTYVKGQTPSRSYLEVEQIVALLAAAEQVERRYRGLSGDDVARIRASSESHMGLARHYGVSDATIRKIRCGEIWNGTVERNRHDVPRVPLLMALLLAGPRVNETCGFDVPDLDFANGRIVVRREVTKTAAGERALPMVPALYEQLQEHVYDLDPAGPAFPNRDGARNTPDNLRRRLAPVLTRANEVLAEQGLQPIRHLTPHTMRRTFASILAVLNVSMPRTIQLLGHTNPTMTLAVYSRVMKMGSGSVEALEAVLGTSAEEAWSVYSGREVLAPIWHQAKKKPPALGQESGAGGQETPRFRGISESG